jgi:diguanylate cyclase (GGDEF)-like protein
MSTSIVEQKMTEWSNIQEEFVAVLPDTDLDEAFSIADKLRIAIEQQDYIHTWRTTARAIPFTVSIGVATRAPGEAEVGTVLKRADQALYKAKQGGRNRVERA